MQKHSFLSIIILLVILLGLVLYVQPLIAHDVELGNMVDQQQMQLTQEKQLLEQKNKIKESIDAMTELEKTKLQTQIPAQLDQNALITTLTLIAQKNGMTIPSLTFSKISNKEDPKKIAITADFSTSNMTIPVVALLQSIEQSDRLFSIKSVSMTQTKGRNDFIMVLESYYQE